MLTQILEDQVQFLKKFAGNQLDSLECMRKTLMEQTKLLLRYRDERGHHAAEEQGIGQAQLERVPTRREWMKKLNKMNITEDMKKQYGRWRGRSEAARVMRRPDCGGAGNHADGSLPEAGQAHTRSGGEGGENAKSCRKQQDKNTVNMITQQDDKTKTMSLPQRQDDDTLVNSCDQGREPRTRWSR